ncbi:MAG: hypothetical protein P4L03_02765 [Terracidiphilus sp.]|nr:hypothetical protein [Terracidiphilus sp.]
MAEKTYAPQQPVISVRISEALRARLDSLKELLAYKSGENVSTSEVAKQLLESAREDRLEVADLLADATLSLVQARKKMEAGLSLSQAEWIVLAYFIRQGAETYREGMQGMPVSKETMKGILEAFLEAYKLRRSKRASRDAHYLGNLPLLNKSGQEVLRSEEMDIPTAIERLIRALEVQRSGVWPQFAARNLYDLLEEESFSSIETLNRVLKPYWMALWKAAARGHFIVCKIPLRDPAANNLLGQRFTPAISSVFESGFVLSFAVGSSSDLSLLLNFPEDRKAMYEMAPYPMIAEFRSLLDHWDSSAQNARWNGSNFFAYTSGSSEANPRVWVRCEGSATFGFSDEEWVSLKECFRRAWEMPELQRVWDELSMEYGEL